MRALAVACLVQAGCGTILGLEDFDHTPTANVSGVVVQNSVSSDRLDDATVSFVRESDDMILSMDVSRNSGAYAVPVPIDIDGHFLIEHAGDEATLQYLAPSVTSDRQATMFLYTPDAIAKLAAHASVVQSNSGGFMLLQIHDAQGNGKAGATAQVSGGTLFYNDENGPGASLTATDAGGIVTVFNVPARPITITVTSGSTTTEPKTVVELGAHTTFVQIRVD